MNRQDLIANGRGQGGQGRQEGQDGTGGMVKMIFPFLLVPPILPVLLSLWGFLSPRQRVPPVTR